MKLIKPIVTLFMIMSVDGKISTGNTDEMDVDSDFPKIHGICEGLHQYYDIEKMTDPYFLITGAVMAKKTDSLNVNIREDIPGKISANCVIIDNTHLKESGITFLLKKFNSLMIVTANEFHPGRGMKLDGLKVITYSEKIDFLDLFVKLKKDFGIQAITIQSGGTMNSVLLREQLIDKISIVVAPALIGGKDTPTLIDGKSLSSFGELKNIKALKLNDVRKMDDSYLYLNYDVINDTVIE